MTFGERVKSLMEERGFRRTYIAMDLECSPTTVWRIENDITRPRKYFVVALANLFGMSYEELMKGVDIE